MDFNLFVYCTLGRREELQAGKAGLRPDLYQRMLSELGEYVETADDLAFSIRNQELVIETLLINVDSSAVASHDHIDSKMVINATVVNDSTVYDTIYPVTVTNVAGDVTYEYGVDYSVISENGIGKYLQ